MLAAWVFLGTLGLLILPKFLAFILLLTQAGRRRKFGGGWIALLGILVETVLSGLIAPVMMIFQSSAVTAILLGRDAGWQVQRRDDGGIARREMLLKYAAPTLVGALMAGSAYAVSLPLFLWMAPVISGLLLAIPIARLCSRRRPRGDRLFSTPEQTAPPKVLIRANELAETSRAQVLCPLHELRRDPTLLQAHLGNHAVKPRRRGQIDPFLAISRAKIEDAENFEEAVGFLNAREKFAVLNSGTALRALLELPLPADPHEITKGAALQA